jgi:hypothetical protein
MTDEMTVLQAYLHDNYKNAVVNLMSFPSGAATLDMRFSDLLLTFEYVPQKGFAVSKIEKDEDAWDPQKCMTFGESEFTKARDYFLFLVKGNIT